MKDFETEAVHMQKAPGGFWLDSEGFLTDERADKLIAWLIEARGHRLVDSQLLESWIDSEYINQKVEETIYCLRGENE